MEKGYESMREEIKRLHRVCQAKSNLLDESRSVMRLYRAFLQMLDDVHYRKSLKATEITESVN